jgi:hypothetical protein
MPQDNDDKTNSKRRNTTLFVLGIGNCGAIHFFGVGGIPMGEDNYHRFM